MQAPVTIFHCVYGTEWVGNALFEVVVGHALNRSSVHVLFFTLIYISSHIPIHVLIHASGHVSNYIKSYISVRVSVHV